MGRKKKVETKDSYGILWNSVSGTGWRVKHRMFRSETLPYVFLHTETRLTDDPVILSKCGYEVHPRQFFGKVWIAQKVESKKATTWKAIGEAVRQLEMKEK